jgi:membrane protein required for colicin V production
MNWLDLVILVIVAIATFYGLRIGVIKAVLSLAGLIVGILLAGRYYAPLAERLTFITQDNVADAAAFAIILIGVMIITSILAALLKWAASVVMLGWVNHLGGAVFGLLLGAMLSGALLTIWVKFLGAPEIINESNLAAILLNRFPAVLALLPEEFDVIHSFFQ